jgi:hypothetical protein
MVAPCTSLHHLSIQWTYKRILKVIVSSTKILHWIIPNFAKTKKATNFKLLIKKNGNWFYDFANIIAVYTSLILSNCPWKTCFIHILIACRKTSLKKYTNFRSDQMKFD